MKKAVVDASVVLQWYLDEDEVLSDSEKILEPLINGNFRLIVPDFIFIELTNVLLKKKKMDKNKFYKTQTAFIDLPIDVISFDIAETLNLGEQIFEHNFSAYDSLYALLAEQENCDLITLDKELLKHPNSVTPTEFLQNL